MDADRLGALITSNSASAAINRPAPPFHHRAIWQPALVVTVDVPVLEDALEEDVHGDCPRGA
jgi:hypothetical protein